MWEDLFKEIHEMTGHATKFAGHRFAWWSQWGGTGLCSTDNWAFPVRITSVGERQAKCCLNSGKALDLG